MQKALDLSVVDALNCGVIMFDADERVCLWNSWIAERSGISSEQAMGKALGDIFLGLRNSRVERAIATALRSGLSTVLSHNLHPRPFALFAGRPDTVSEARPSAPIDQSTVVRALKDGSGRPLCLVQVSDVTATVVRENRLREMADYARSLLEASIDPFITISPGGTITDVNAATEQVTGLERGALIGSQFVDWFVEPEHAAAGLETALRQSALKDFPLSIRQPSGRLAELHFNISVYRNRAGEIEGMLAAGRDMTQQKAVERELVRLATTDTLTGAANRRHFLELAERDLLRARRYQQPLALLSVDADHFKAINDTYGHPAGDEVLRRLVALWRLHLRDTDTVGRLGGEEFLILLPEISPSEALAVAERLRQASAQMLIHSNGLSFNVTISVGVAAVDSAETLQRALARVDHALYKAKTAGRNRICLASPSGVEQQGSATSLRAPGR